MRRFFRNNGLTITLLLLFAGSIFGQFVSGHHFENQELAAHGQPPIALLAYLTDDRFLSVLFENWESEFLQMSAYVVLTACLFQKGSSESADPDAAPRDERMHPSQLTEKSPLALRAGSVVRWLYSHSLGIVLFLLFVASFLGHWHYSARQAETEAALHGRDAPDRIAYLADPGFWFESFQNWQSEFLSTAVLILLSIYLRERGSPESKPVGAAHEETGV